MASSSFNPLRIKNIIKETNLTRSLVFDIPGEFIEAYKYRAGQYLTLKVVINGSEQRRAYSISSAPDEGMLKVSVKKVEDGFVSKYLCDDLEEGTEIEVMTPEGNFTMDYNPDKKRAFYFIAAGSGITPIMSLIKDGLEKEPLSSYYLLDGNSNEDQIIFKQELETLTEKYKNQFYVQHTLSSLDKGGFVSKIFGKKKNVSDDGYWAGRIDASKINRFLKDHPVENREAHFFICGPGDMIKKSAKAIESMGFDQDVIHKEYFVNDGEGLDVEQYAGDVQLTAVLDGNTYNTEIKEGKTILDALIDIGADPPYSCTSGVCSTCMAKLKSGEVEMETCLALDDDEIADGYILTCQSHPKTAEVTVEYE